MNTIVNIQKPCLENWGGMSAKAGGRYCDTCEKVVKDLTKMSDEELIKFLSNEKGNACGRFRADQVRVTKKNVFHHFKFKIAASFALIFTRFLFSSEAKAQEANTTETSKGNIAEKKLFGDSVVYHITGKLTNRNTGAGIRYAAVKVEVNGKPVGGSTYTDGEGKYELNVAVKNSSEVIDLSFEKRHFKAQKVANYTPDGKEMQIKMRQKKNNLFHHEHYIMGRYVTGSSF